MVGASESSQKDAPEEIVPRENEPRRAPAPVGPGEVLRQELKFQRLAGDLRRGILDATWPAGSKLPTEQALVGQTGFSLSTVRRAYDELASQGFVERRQGAGTFVIAQAEKAHKGLSVGVMVPDTHAYYPRVLQGIERALTAAGARMTLVCSHYDEQLEGEAIQGLVDARVDGLLLVPSLHAVSDPLARLTELERLPVPFVLVERRLPGDGPVDSTFHVCTDHAGGAFDAMRHLVSLGHERIGLILRDDAPTARGVRAGWEAALAQYNLPALEPFGAGKSAWDQALADAAWAHLQGQHASAVICFGDREALLLTSAASRAGKAIPGDLAVISYDNEIADLAEVPLTAVSPPKYRLGRLAAELLLERIAEGQDFPPQQIQLRPTLVVRASCGAKPLRQAT